MAVYGENYTSWPQGPFGLAKEIWAVFVENREGGIDVQCFALKMTAGWMQKPEVWHAVLETVVSWVSVQETMADWVSVQRFVLEVMTD